MDDQISMLKWHQKENVMVQIRTPVSLVTKSRLDHVWGHPTISIFMEWNKVCSISFMEIARGHSKMRTSASDPAAEARRRRNKLLQTNDWAEILSHMINCMNLEQFEEVEMRMF